MRLTVCAKSGRTGRRLVAVQNAAQSRTRVSQALMCQAPIGTNRIPSEFCQTSPRTGLSRRSRRAARKVCSLGWTAPCTSRTFETGELQLIADLARSDVVKKQGRLPSFLAA